MTPKPYRFFINPFLVATRYSYKKALSLGVDHKSKLIANQSDPVVAAMLVSFDPVLQSYLATDQNLASAEGTYEGKTQTVEELFELMNDEKLAYWEGQLFVHYPKGTASATNLLPDSRKPFQKGTYEQRIQAIKVLGDKCALDALLVPVSVNILAFHTQIESARQLQQSQGEGAVENLRTLRETARVLLCQELYGNMGKLMHLYRANPIAISNYFDITLLRSRSDWQKFDINANTVFNVEDDIEPGDISGLIVKNTSLAASGVILYIYTGASASAPWNGQGITLAPGEEKELDENDFGAILPFFNVQNQSGNAATFEIKGL